MKIDPFHIPVYPLFHFFIPQGLTDSDLGVRTLLDYTDRVSSIIDDIRANPPTSTQECCSYEKQILDKYCASRPFVSVSVAFIYMYAANTQ